MEGVARKDLQPGGGENSAPLFQPRIIRARQIPHKQGLRDQQGLKGQQVQTHGVDHARLPPLWARAGRKAPKVGKGAVSACRRSQGHSRRPGELLASWLPMTTHEHPAADSGSEFSESGSRLIRIGFLALARRGPKAKDPRCW